MKNSLVSRATARTRGDMHIAAMKADPDGLNHGLVRLRTPKGKTIGIVCLCGLQFWTHRDCVLPQPKDFKTRDAFVRAFRVAIGVSTQDPGKRKARKMAGVTPKKSKQKGWF